MVSDHTIRASDLDRDAVVDTLRDAYVAGRLTLEEFNERTAATYASRTWGDLRELTADLPAQPVLGADVPGRGGPQVPGIPGRDTAQFPSLPSAPPLPGPQRTPPRPAHRGYPGALIPFIMFWVVVSLVTRSPVLVVIPIVVVLVSGIFRRL